MTLFLGDETRGVCATRLCVSFFKQALRSGFHSWSVLESGFRLEIYRIPKFSRISTIYNRNIYILISCQSSINVKKYLNLTIKGKWCCLILNVMESSFGASAVSFFLSFVHGELFQGSVS